MSRAGESFNIFVQECAEDIFKFARDNGVFLALRYLRVKLKALEAVDYFVSENLVERLCEPLMNYPPDKKREVTENACGGLEQLESNRDKRRKYFEFVVRKAALSPEELANFRQEYVERSSFREDYVTIAELIVEERAGEVKAKYVIELFTLGVLTAQQAREQLLALLSRKEAPRNIIDELLKKLPSLNM